MNRLAAAEARAEGDDGKGRLPIVLPVEQLDSAEAHTLRDRGYIVVSMEQCAEMMV